MPEIEIKPKSQPTRGGIIVMVMGSDLGIITQSQLNQGDSNYHKNNNALYLSSLCSDLRACEDILRSRSL